MRIKSSEGSASIKDKALSILNKFVGDGKMRKLSDILENEQRVIKHENRKVLNEMMKK